MRSRLVTLTLLLLLASPYLLSAQASTPQRNQNVSSSELLKTANTFFDQKDYQKARVYYLKALPSYPHNFDLVRNLAFCYFSGHNYSRATQYYGRAYTLNPGSPEVADRLASCYMALKRYSEAASIYNKLASLPDASPEVLRNAAIAYDLGRHFPEASAAYLAYLKRKPQDLEARTGLGVLYASERNYEKAEAEFHRVLSADPKFLPALVSLGRVLAWQGQTGESLILYDRALQVNPKSIEALTGKGFTLLWMGRAQEAHALFTRFHQQYPYDPEIARGLAAAEAALEETAVEAARQPGDLGRTEGYYRQRLAKNPADLAALKALAELTATTQECPESIKFGRKAVDLAPGDPAYELTLAHALAPCQQYPEAIARYRRFLLFHPQAGDKLYELGDTLLRARRFEEAAATFRSLLQLDPKNADATLGLARALAESKNYPEALLRYDKVLEISPDNYDALQGKGFALYYTGQYTQARLIFQRLVTKEPNDSDNAETLANIEQAEEGARWAALLPPPDAPPQAFVDYYQRRLASYPNDEAALRGLAAAQAQLKNKRAAIQAYQRLLELSPDDRDAKIELARQLSFDRQYDLSINLYRDLLRATPNDTEALEALTHVYGWAGRDRDALDLYQSLLAQDPSNPVYKLDVARIQLRLKDYPAARDVLVSLLSTTPQNREARLNLGQLDLNERRLGESMENFDYVLHQDPRDVDALYGKARASYYRGDISQARAAAAKLVEEHPDNYDALFLLANIEHASGHRQETLTLLDRAARLSPHSPEVIEMKHKVSEEAAVTITTSASYAREIGAPEAFKAAQGSTRTGLPNEDLRVYSYGTVIETSLLPRVDSSLQLSLVPTGSPPGPLRDAQGSQIPTLLTGVAVPWVFISQNTWRPSERFTLRGGAGLIRFGPGNLQTSFVEPTPSASATLSPLAFTGISFAPRKKLSFDLNVAREAVTDSVPAIRLGVMESRVDGRLNLFFSSRTELHLEYYYGRFSSVPFNHTSLVNGQQVIQKKAGHDDGTGGTATFTTNLFRSARFSFDGGYTGVAFGFSGFRNGIYLGYYNPSFYQRHVATARCYGKLFGPLSYDFTAGIGVQQSLQGQALTRALNIYPAFTLKVSPHLSFTAGFIHYNTALALGPLRGNEVRLSTETKF